MSEVAEIREAFTPSDKLRIDREKHIVYNCKILGERSLNAPPNNNVYPPSTRSRAIESLQGARANVNHAAPGQQGLSRPYQDTFGTHWDIHETGKGLASNFHYNPKHALCEQFLWDAEHAPQNVGFSIATNGRRVQKNGEWIVEEILFDKNRHSIDLVGRGATTSTLYESLGSRPMKKISALIEELKDKRPGYVRALREMAESGIMSPDYQTAGPASADAPVADTPAASESKDHKQAIKDAAKAILDDDALDEKEMIDKIKKLLAIISGKSSGNGNGDSKTSDTPPPAEKKDEDKTTEALRTELATFRSRDLLRTKADAANVKVPGTVMAMLRPNITDAEAAALVEELKGQAGPTSTAWGASHPRSAAPFTQPSGNGTAALRDGKPVTTPITEGIKSGPEQKDPDKARAERVAARRMQR